MKSLLRQFSSLGSRPQLALLFWSLAFAYLAVRADEGWIPHDEGLLGQSAERLLYGELPHRDFDEPYTGALTWLHAAAFRVFGLELVSLRWMLLGFSGLFIVACHRIARRFSGPWWAGWATWVAVAWSLPVYFAGLPSWYNLFFATFGILAFLRYLETDSRSWLVAAGFWAGVSCLIKPIGLYDVVAGLLFLIYREQMLSAVSAMTDDSTPLSSPVPGASLVARAYRATIVAALLLLVGLLSALVSRTPRPMEMLHFVLPLAAVGGFLIWHEHQLPRTVALHEARWRRLSRLLWPFLVGLGGPVALFLMPYLASGSLGDLLYGVFVLPQRRFQFASTPLTGLSTLWPMLPVGVLVVWSVLRPEGRIPRIIVAATAVGAALALAFGHTTPVYLAVWHSVRPLVPVLILTGIIVLIRAPPEFSGEARQRLFMLVAMLCMLSLVQYPESFYIYFAYVAPAAVLTWLALVGQRPRSDVPDVGSGLAWGWLHAIVLAFYLAFAVLWQHRSLPLAMGQRYWEITNDTRLDVDRGGLLMPRPMAEAYRELVRLISQHSLDGSYIYATPDCPEVYFLSGRRNPTRTFFDFFESDYLDDPRKRSARLLTLLEAHDVDVVVFCTAPQFSLRPFPPFAEQVQRRYPHRTEVPTYTIHWREPSARAVKPQS